MTLRSRSKTTVTLTKNVSAGLAAFLGLAPTDQQVGDVLQLPYGDARGLILGGYARWGSPALDAAETPTIAQGAAYRPRQRPAVAGVPYYARGTSYTAGAVASAGLGYVDLVASALGATATHNAGTGGSTTPALCAQYANGGANGWTPGTSTGLVSIEVGIGEALQEDDATWAGHRAVFENQTLTALRWHRASEARQGNHATISLQGATEESLLGIGALDVPNGVKMTADGSGFTITLNESRDDVEIVLLTVPWKQTADATNNGDYKFRVGAGAWRTGSTVGKGDPRPDGSNILLSIGSERLTGLPGNATITVQKVGGTGEVWFWGYLVMNNPAPPPIVLVQDVHLVESAGQWVMADTGQENPRRNNATLEVYRQTVRDIAHRPEFADGTVVVADPLPRFDPATMLGADGIHPNNNGHAIYAAAVQSAAALVGVA